MIRGTETLKSNWLMQHEAIPHTNSRIGMLDPL
jgi:hypothetical protein